MKNTIKTTTVLLLSVLLLSAGSVTAAAKAPVAVPKQSSDVSESGSEAGGTEAPGCVHVFGAATKVDDATHTHTCELCGESETVPHTWNSGETVKAANCTETGTKLFICTACSATREETIPVSGEHVFSDWVKTDEKEHTRSCTLCGETETAVHTYATEWGSDETSHFHACTGCGDRIDIEEHIPGDEPTEETPQTCTVCGFEIEPKLEHKHRWSNAWVCDSVTHWFPCAGCDARKDSSRHVYETGCATECFVCGYRRTAEHRYEYRFDETSHWQECKYCGLAATAKEAHSFDPDAAEDAPKICLICAYELGTAETESETEMETETEPGTAETDASGSEDSENEPESNDPGNPGNDAEQPDGNTAAPGGNDPNGTPGKTGFDFWSLPIPLIACGAGLLTAAITAVVVLATRKKREPAGIRRAEANPSNIVEQTTSASVPASPEADEIETLEINVPEAPSQSAAEPASQPAADASETPPQEPALDTPEMPDPADSTGDDPPPTAEAPGDASPPEEKTSDTGLTN